MAAAKVDAKQMNVKKTTYEKWFNQIVTLSMFTPHHEDNPADTSCRWGQPSILWGGSGIGKSARIKQLARRAGLECRVVMPAQRLPEDFAGVLTPNPSSPTGVSIECLLPAVRSLITAGGGVLFVDEAGNAPPAVQGAMLGMLLDRVVGDTPLPPKVRILLAANPPEIAAGGFGFDPPTANRMAHFDMGPPTFEEWADHYRNRYEVPTDPVDYEAVVRQAWPSVAPQVQGMLLGFLHSKRDMKDRQPPPGDPAGGRAWPSSRTWEMAANAMMARRALSMPEELDDVFVEGFVGEGPSIEFSKWRKDANLPKPEDVLDGKWRHNPNRLDITYAVMSTVVPYLAGKPEGEAQQAAAVKAWQFFGRMVDVNAADLVIGPAVDIINRLQLGVSGKKTNPEISKVAADVIGYLGKAGYGDLI